MYRDSPNYPVKNSWMLWSELEKNQNVTFKRTDIPLSDYPQKRSTLIAAGQTPEIVTAVASGEETPFVAGGQILPVSDYLKYMPNLSARLKEWKLTDLFNSQSKKMAKFISYLKLVKFQLTIILLPIVQTFLKKLVSKPQQLWMNSLKRLKHSKQNIQV